METFGDRLRRLRTERRLSLDELAGKTGVTKAYLWRLETSPGVNPSLDILHKLASGLGVTVSSLIVEQVVPGGPSIDIPSALREAKEQFGISDEDTQDLSRIRFRGGQPLSKDDWLALYFQLKKATSKGD